jgi:hypothetical protein
VNPKVTTTQANSVSAKLQRSPPTCGVDLNERFEYYKTIDRVIEIRCLARDRVHRVLRFVKACNHGRPAPANATRDLF